MLGTSLGATMDGIEARIVNVEADVSRGLPQFSIVGLPDSAVTESKLRIRSAIRNSGLEFPLQRITVNLSPASVRKHGAGLDLPIAIAILRASRQLPEDMVTHRAFCGELALSGSIIPVDGLVNIALGLHRATVAELYFSQSQAHQSIALPPLQWYGVKTLTEIVDNLRHPSHKHPLEFSGTMFDDSDETLDMSDVMSLNTVKRALTVAAVGRHHIFIVGPPGCGKTMLAQRFSNILPRLSDEAAIAAYAIHQAAGINCRPSHIPPLRIPHHSLTPSGLIGGGSSVHPGEATLAHHGVLVLDEVLEFKRSTLDALREPLVHKRIHLARSGRHVTLPADFQLVGTLNPCPCGQYGSSQCHCGERTIRQYWSALSGPLLDRIDITVSVPVTEHHFADTSSKSTYSPKTTEELRTIIVTARDCLTERYHHLSSSGEHLMLEDFSVSAQSLLEQVSTKLHISRRGLKSVERIARSISVLEHHTKVQLGDIKEALSLRTTLRF